MTADKKSLKFQRNFIPAGSRIFISKIPGEFLLENSLKLVLAKSRAAYYNSTQ